jgi:tyrosine-specific transport protein
MNSKLFGGILLVTGTTIGAGMLALPAATAQLGFLGSLVLLFSGWLVMLTCAFLFLEVNLWLPPNTNIISMAGATLGRGGQAVAWLVYLLLMYSIISAYTSGGADIFGYILGTAGIPISKQTAALVFTALFGVVVYFGIRIVDYVNRCLMFGKMGSFLVLALLIAPFISLSFLSEGEFKHILSPSSITVTALAFGNLIIIPSLRTYFADDIVSLRKAIFVGTLIPLICYVAWDMVILGVIPLEGAHGFNKILESNDTNSSLLAAITFILNKDSITLFAKFFTSICMATSFLSLSLSLSDFLADGFRVKKSGLGGILVFSVTFLPPLIAVLYFPDMFMRGLTYGGVCCLILMVLLPALMAWRGRGQLSNGKRIVRSIRESKILLAGLIVFSLSMIAFGGGKWIFIGTTVFAIWMISYTFTGASLKRRLPPQQAAMTSDASA